MVYDYLIVGAGMAGVSLAYRLPRDAQVLILERESHAAYHSTGRSAAMFVETYGTETIRALTVAGNDFFSHPPEGFTDQPILLPRGVLYVGTAEQQDLLDSQYQDWLEQGLDVSRLSAEQALALVPCLDPDTLAGALYDGQGQDMDVHALHQGFLKGAQAKGVSLRLDAEVVSAQWDGECWDVQLEGEATRLRTRVLVNAAGAWADTLAQRCGVQALGIQPKRRSAFLFSPPEGVDHRQWPAVIDIGEEFYFKPDAGMLLGSPANADDVQAHDVVAEELDVATGIYRIEERTRLRIRRPSHTWAGLRSFAPDGELVIGQDAQCPGFFWLAGQGGYGIQTAAGASLLAASLLQQQELPESLKALNIDPAVVSPARFRT
ncbi:FAD dependent oxidoreductase [Alcaligenes faecalis subsp. faecalis NCIB 8687]|jgi:D-arginine dehydrogenase|uniref:FAD-binding oxidoreductase n=1 Tax=Alcaligenes ammonioxydans TaxID=2582914 RepID=A0ABX8SVV2_9BURK|nr:FAD-dependent oxidoreductase [Alcaligenes ammonioxydans]EJC65770.1 FAD dependent oxidoreductase [Alcaligenes faecalis subsp. faecalis NCIB 8687]QXX79033.1 FAD-binding oxidoreductase [Alcaligenes ammonioxydans]WGQ37160.1 FAD-dependent oxidoreductase [Alcaligenes faecalis]